MKNNLFSTKFFKKCFTSLFILAALVAVCSVPKPVAAEETWDQTCFATVNSFTSSALTVNSGQSFTLSWNASFSDKPSDYDSDTYNRSIVIYTSDGSYLYSYPGYNSGTYTYTTSITSTTTFELYAYINDPYTNPQFNHCYDGASSSRSVTVSVNTPPGTCQNPNASNYGQPLPCDTGTPVIGCTANNVSLSADNTNLPNSNSGTTLHVSLPSGHQWDVSLVSGNVSPSPSSGNNSGGDLATGSLTQSHQYRLTCKNADNTTVEKEVTVNVASPTSCSIDSFTTDDANLNPFTATRLRFTFSGGSFPWFVTAISGPKQPDAPSAGTGSGGSVWTGDISQPHTYRVTCQNPNGTTVTKDVSVGIIQPVCSINSFGPDSSLISSGTGTNLRFSLNGSYSWALSLVGGNVTPSPTSGTSSSGVIPTGNISQDHSYRLTCYNSNGSNSSQVRTVLVSANTCPDTNATNYGGTLPCTYPTSTCQDHNATNYNGNLPCTYPSNTSGLTCQDSNATNFGGSLPCTYPAAQVCQDRNATNYGGGLPCAYPSLNYVCSDSNASNYGFPGACVYDNTCQDRNATNYGGSLPCSYPSYVCIDHNANNYGGALPCTYPPANAIMCSASSACISATSYTQNGTTNVRADWVISQSCASGYSIDPSEPNRQNVVRIKKTSEGWNPDLSQYFGLPWGQTSFMFPMSFTSNSYDVSLKLNPGSSKGVVLTFPCLTHVLTINKVGTGAGGVQGAGTYSDGIAAPVAASANPGSTFTGWGGDCVGSGYNTSVLMNADKTCTASFTLGNGPTGTISATSCTIPTGSSTCNSSVTWTTSNLISGAATAVTRNYPDNTTISSAISGASVPNAIGPGSYTYYLYHNGMILAQTGANAVTAACASGSWDGTKCSDAPTNGVCGVMHYNCIVPANTSGASQSENSAGYTWVCPGVNGGNNSQQCSESKSGSGSGGSGSGGGGFNADGTNPLCPIDASGKCSCGAINPPRCDQYRKQPSYIEN